MNWKASIPAIPPATVLLAVLLFVVLTLLASVYLLTQQVWTGINVSTDATHSTLTIESIDEDSPAFGKLQVGERLAGIKTEQGLLKLTPLLNNFAPLSPATFKDLDAFYHYQATLHEAFIQRDGLTFVTTSGHTAKIVPLAHTPLLSIPIIFWLLCLLNLISPLVGVLVWTYKPHQKASLFLLFQGIFYYLFAVNSATVIATEFYLPPDALQQVLLLQVIGIGFAAALIVLILFYTPTTLTKGHWLLWSVLGMTALSIANYHYRWLETPVHIYYMQHPIFYSSAIGAIFLQWPYTKQQPLERTSLLILTVSFILPTTFILALHVGPILLGIKPLVGNTPILLFFILIASGLAIGILRYRLFDIEFWWLKSLIWLLGGCLVALIDLSLTALLHASATYTLALSIIIAGFVYFPLRQWLLAKLVPSDRESLQDFLPTFSLNMANATSAAMFEQGWQESLLQRYHPLHLSLLEQKLSKVELSDNGLHLLIPTIKGDQSYRLSGKQRAAHLFNRKDVKYVEALLTIARMVSNASEDRKQVILEERQRIMHDLHDTMGAKLLSLAHQAPQAFYKQQVLQAMQTLRETVRVSVKSNPLSLSEHLADWRVEIAERCEHAGVSLHWQQASELETEQIQARQLLDLSQTLRELVTNALKHASPSHLSIKINRSPTHLELNLAHNGNISCPSTWIEGTGLKSMTKRIHENLAGQIKIYIEPAAPSLLIAQITIPL